ncbi:Desumoylating isopeptidase 1 Short=DeSI-1; AltName: Full=PPPDE peptidase domain-containing protein 2; AltName: Full=Protein FAM152B [Serendipita indica DSM 11827]|nr:Desumoylating isopeptidase 1 Short=DeSI-1; AltName: Full=PPPDE peptidase domain-containing protein 2; AltName: Full=Protein FAM152B [Serendipita indica DSM 11827]
MATVQLYVYDLSRGMAAQLSQQLTGRHTSIVFHGKEWYYGAGIHNAPPGRTHLGPPLRILDLGISEIDEETFMEYISEMRSVYTPDAYHLLDFNCNSFTNDCAGFLTGGSIPDYIRDLPTDFLSTPFGQALRPTIDQMYRRGGPGQPPVQPANDIASQITRSVATNALGPTISSKETATLASPIQICTNNASFDILMQRHKAVIAFFTSQTCAPCKMVEPVFEELAHAKASPDVAFVKVDMSVGLGSQVGQAHNVRATPTFLFFLDGKKKHELKGANAPELRSQVNLLIYDAFPPHPHSKLTLRELRATSLNPILFTQIPKLDALSTKLLSAVETSPLPVADRGNTKEVIANGMIRSLSSIPNGKTPTANSTKVPETEFSNWTSVTVQLAAVLPPTDFFPLVDLWRLALLIPDVSTQLATSPIISLPTIFKISSESASSPDAKNLTLTALRLACNIFVNPVLTRRLLQSSPANDGSRPRDAITNLLVSALLSDVATVRVAAASLAFNIAAFLQAPLMQSLNRGMSGTPIKEDSLDDAEWEVELLSAVIEAIDREDNEDSLHRLVSCLGLLVHLSPHLAEIQPLLEVLQVKQTLVVKAQPDGPIKKENVKKLVKEVTNELC